MERVNEILSFWFGDGSDPEHERRWFAQDAAFDHASRAGFHADHERAAVGELDSWKETPSGALALILLLDQFPRNIFRGSPRAFATDHKARATAKEAITRGFDLALPPARRSFIYIPFSTVRTLMTSGNRSGSFTSWPRRIPRWLGTSNTPMITWKSSAASAASRTAMPPLVASRLPTRSLSSQAESFMESELAW